MFRETGVRQGVPSRVRQFIRAHVDVHLQDVHAMMRLPLPEQDISAACNFAISAVLLNVISGLSVTLYDPTTQDHRGQLFVELAKDFYPWDREPSGAVVNARGAQLLYQCYRNPLAHHLGSDSPASISRQRTGWTELELEKIEAHRNVRPVELLNVATLNVGPDQQPNLNADCLYWGVRELVERLTGDAAKMRGAAAHL